MDNIQEMLPSQGDKDRKAKAITSSIVDGDNESIKDTASDDGMVLYKRRWAMLAMFCLLTWSSAFLWITFAPISTIVEEYYGVGSGDVNWMSMLYMLTYLPGVFIASWIMDLIGLRNSMIAGAFLNCLGGWIRYVGKDPSGWTWIFVGQTIAAIAQSFTLSAPPRIAAEWFGERERSTATSVGVLSNNMGIAVGMLSNYVVTKGSDIPTYLLIDAIIVSVALILVVLFFRSTPPTPPTRSSCERNATNGESTRLGFLIEVKMLCSNYSFWFLVIAYGATVGTYYGLSTLIASVLPSPPWDSVIVGWIGFVMTVGGVVGAIVCGHILDRTGAFKKVNVFLYMGALVFMIGFLFTVEYGSEWLLFIITILLGFFMTGIMPVAFEFAGEISYPVSENVSSGVLNFSANLIALIPIYCLTNASPFTINLTFTAMMGAGFLAVIFVKEKLTRYAMDNKEVEVDV
eukprot:Nk52_evm79s270 gene=Nk52_evmTU79s270